MSSLRPAPRVRDNLGIRTRTPTSSTAGDGDARPDTKTGRPSLASLGSTPQRSGVPPFQADSIPRLMDKIVHHRHRPVSDLRDDVPAGVDAILDRALAKDPANRYESGKAMALALRECCSTFPSEIL